MIFICTISVLPLAIAASFASFYWIMWTQSIKLDEFKSNYGQTLTYDRCVADPYALHLDYSASTLDTQWSFLLAFNSILYVCLGLFTLFLCSSSLLRPCIIAGACGHFFGFCTHLAGIIITGILRFGRDGELCSFNTDDVPYNEEGDSFKFSDHGAKIQYLFISSCALYFFHNCCICTIGRAFRLGMAPSSD